jgi:hypothetical protein
MLPHQDSQAADSPWWRRRFLLRVANAEALFSILYNEPMVAGAWMGLAVKTDGAAADALIRAKALEPAYVISRDG